MIKRFSDWFNKKENIHFKNHKPPYFKEREIWWCQVGENIGNEINGKSDYFRRPVLIIKKLSLHSFLAVPMTSVEKTGTWYLSIEHGIRKSALVISQIRQYDYRRLDKKMGSVSEEDLQKVIKSFVDLILIK